MHPLDSFLPFAVKYSFYPSLIAFPPIRIILNFDAQVVLAAINLVCENCSISPYCPFGGGGYSMYKPYRYVLPQRVGFLRLFGVKTSIDFVHFDLESGS